MKKINTALSPEHIAFYKRLGMRDKIEECIQNNSPYIPFLGPYNKRICFLEEYGPYVKDNLVNVDKIVLVQEILDQFYKFKSKKYEIVRNPKNEFIIFYTIIIFYFSNQQCLHQRLQNQKKMIKMTQN